MTKQECEDLVDYVIEKILTGTTDDLLPVIKEDGEIHICLGNHLESDSFAGTFIGKNGTKNFLNICNQFLEFSYITPVDYHHEKDKMIVRGDLKCQMLANGTVWSSSWMQIWTFENGKIGKLRMFADFHTVALPEHVQSDLKQAEMTHH